ncbi:hypothetical protein T11_7853 [Trichinella zimbabwensis]|uniref:Uncharacterized protein n=1 Tax=Trichinella zimbabwensis TaxID=268475 RepID=A0A0V1HJV4_9BILA|nr:hypothetical protein T11_7853 [Trichinella zimbabwensis]
MLNNRVGNNNKGFGLHFLRDNATMLHRPSAFVVCAFLRNRQCRIFANTCRFYSYNPPPPVPYNPTQLSESFKRYHGPSTDLHSKSLPEVDGLSGASFLKNIVIEKLLHYVFTQILRCSHAVLDCVSLKAEVWTCPDMSGPVDQSGASVWNRGTGAAVDQPPVRSASFPCNLIISSVWLSRYHYCYGVEPHKRKQPCTESADPQHTYTLGSKNRICFFGKF